MKDLSSAAKVMVNAWLEAAKDGKGPIDRKAAMFAAARNQAKTSYLMRLSMSAETSALWGDEMAAAIQDELIGILEEVLHFTDYMLDKQGQKP